MTKHIDLLARLNKAFGQNSKALRPRFPLKPECINHDVIFIPTDDIDGFFRTKQDYERRFGCLLVSDLSEDEKALVTAITGSLSPTSIRDFLIKRCGYDATDARALSWDAIIRIIRDYLAPSSSPQSSSSSSPQSSSSSPQKTIVLTERQLTVLRYLGKNPRMRQAIPDIQSEVDYAKNTIRGILDELHDLKLVQRHKRGANITDAGQDYLKNR